MQSIVDFSLAVSGQPLSIPNAVQAGSGSTLALTYNVAGGPATLTVSILGIINATGDSFLLDSYSGTANTTRTINLAETFDSFQVVATWSGGLNVIVSGTASFTGAGAVFSGSFSTVLTGNGSPQNVLAAPVGSLYTSQLGGSNVTLWVKEGGASTASGWVAK